MNRILMYVCSITLSITFSMTVNADIENGKELHNSNCVSCHVNIQGGDGTGIYTRENNRIHSYPALSKQVNRCRDSLGMTWPKEHVEDVVEYLNTSFYKFNK